MFLAVPLFQTKPFYLKTPVMAASEEHNAQPLCERSPSVSVCFVCAGAFFEFSVYPLAQQQHFSLQPRRYGALNRTHASQSPTEPTPAAPPPLIAHDEQPSSAKLSLKSQWTPLPLPLASAEWISFSAGLCLLGRFHVKASPLG